MQAVAGERPPRAPRRSCRRSSSTVPQRSKSLPAMHRGNDAADRSLIISFFGDESAADFACGGAADCGSSGGGGDFTGLIAIGTAAPFAVKKERPFTPHIAPVAPPRKPRVARKPSVPKVAPLDTSAVVERHQQASQRDDGNSEEDNSNDTSTRLTEEHLTNALDSVLQNAAAFESSLSMSSPKKTDGEPTRRRSRSSRVAVPDLGATATAVELRAAKKRKSSFQAADGDASGPVSSPPARAARRAASVVRSVDHSAASCSSGVLSPKAERPQPVGLPQVRKFVVEPNAYHCTFVQATMNARGPEWKPTLRSAEKLTAADIATCEFVWFKYEHIKSINYYTRTRLPDDMVAKLRTRTADILAQQDPAAPIADREDDPDFVALRLLNAFITTEEAEVPVDVPKTYNIARQRMPSMALVQTSQAHIIDTPANLSPEVLASLQRLRPLLHYHNMKYPKGIPVMGCFKEASAVWRKHLLYRYLKQYCDNKPEQRGSVRERCPMSFEFDLNNASHADEAMDFMHVAMTQHGVVRWLAKATGGANGNGFYVTKDPAEMVRYVTSQPKKQGGETDFWVIQEFVERMPLLYGGHRFHMKVHVVVIASPVGLEIYAYNRQRIQCCSELFDADVMHPLSFIGNWGQQRHATNLVQENFSRLLVEIKDEYPQLLPAWHRAKQIIAEAVEAAWLCGRQHFDFTVGCYELMGWDFVMEECPDGVWRPLLVEANHRPGFGSERKYMEKLIHETMDLVMYPIYGLSRYQKETHNGEIEAIWDHVKTLVIAPSLA